MLFPLVRKLARRVRRVVPAADFDDLIGDGALGLIRAVDTFDPTRGIALDGYATRVVIGAMLNGLRRLDPISERVRRTMRDADRLRFERAQQEGTIPSFVALEAEIPALRRARAIVYRYVPLSLDAPLPADAGCLADPYADPAECFGRARSPPPALRVAGTATPHRGAALFSRPAAARDRPGSAGLAAARFAASLARAHAAPRRLRRLVSPRVDADHPGLGGEAYGGRAEEAIPLAPLTFDPDADLGHHLPADHPAWTRDTYSLSSRARTLIAQLKPVVLRVLTFWDHRVRSIVVGGRTLGVDPSGCYRCER